MLRLITNNDINDDDNLGIDNNYDEDIQRNKRGRRLGTDKEGIGIPIKKK